MGRERPIGLLVHFDFSGSGQALQGAREPGHLLQNLVAIALPSPFLRAEPRLCEGITPSKPMDTRPFGRRYPGCFRENFAPRWNAPIFGCEPLDLTDYEIAHPILTQAASCD